MRTTLTPVIIVTIAIVAFVTFVFILQPFPDSGGFWDSRTGQIEGM